MNMNTDNRVSPQAPEIEEAILGACLIEQEAMPLVADTRCVRKCSTACVTK